MLKLVMPERNRGTAGARRSELPVLKCQFLASFRALTTLFLDISRKFQKISEADGIFSESFWFYFRIKLSSHNGMKKCFKWQEIGLTLFSSLGHPFFINFSFQIR